MNSFEYANPTTLQEALGLLGAKWGQADVLAGGTDLISLMKEYRHSPKRVVNIKNIKELGGIRSSKGGLRIAAIVTIEEITQNADIRKHFPSLLEAARGVTSPQIRNMGTVGGDLCQRPRCWYYRGGHGLLAKDKNGKSLVPNGENKYHAILGNSGPAYFVSASSLGPALIALNARVKLVSAKGPREVPVAKFFVAPKDEASREIALQPNEILTEIEVPNAPAGSKAIYVKEMVREIWDFALCSVAAMVTVKNGVVADARIVLGGVAPIPYRAAKAEAAVVGKPLTEASATAAGAAAVEGARPLAKNAYKVPLTQAVVKRALMSLA